MNTHNLDAIYFATGEVFFSRYATSRADAQSRGYSDFGNITGISISPDVTKVEHNGSYQGIRRVDRTVISGSKLEYTVKLDELSREKMLFALLGSKATDHSQPALTSTPGTPLVFTPATPAVVGNWYDIFTAGGGRIYQAEDVEFATLTEGVDFELEPKLCRVKFLTPQTATLTPEITAPAIAAGDGMKGIDPMSNMTQKGYGRIVCYDDNHPGKVVIDHFDFSCEISFDSMNEFDGQNFGELTLKVLVTDDRGRVNVAE